MHQRRFSPKIVPIRDEFLFDFGDIPDVEYRITSDEIEAVKWAIRLLEHNPDPDTLDNILILADLIAPYFSVKVPDAFRSDDL